MKIRTLIAIVALGAVTNVVHAQGDAAAGQAKSAVCTACHGADGNSTNPLWPKIAGQHESYLVKQLKDFKSGKQRSNAMMTPIVAALSDQDMLDLAAYYASRVQSGGFANEETVMAGESIYRGGNQETGLPACMSCHGPDGGGNPQGVIPMISGQHSDYSKKQLEDFRSNERSNDPNGMMRDFTKRMTPEEMQAVSEYLAGLH